MNRFVSVDELSCEELNVYLRVFDNTVSKSRRLAVERVREIEKFRNKRTPVLIYYNTDKFLENTQVKPKQLIPRQYSTRNTVEVPYRGIRLVPDTSVVDDSIATPKRARTKICVDLQQVRRVQAEQTISVQDAIKQLQEQGSYHPEEPSVGMSGDGNETKQEPEAGVTKTQIMPEVYVNSSGLQFVPKWNQVEPIEYLAHELEMLKRSGMFATDQILIHTFLVANNRQAMFQNLNQSQVSDLNQFISYLKSVYGRSVDKLRIELECIKQGLNEHEAVYIKRIERVYLASRKQALNAELTQPDKDAITYYFLKGLRCEYSKAQMRAKMLDMQYNNLVVESSFLREAQETLVRQAAAAPSVQISSVLPSAVETNRDAVLISLVEDLKNIKLQVNAMSANVKCFECGGQHYARNCQASTKSSRSYNRSRSRGDYRGRSHSRGRSNGRYHGRSNSRGRNSYRRSYSRGRDRQGSRHNSNNRGGSRDRRSRDRNSRDRDRQRSGDRGSQNKRDQTPGFR
jgi:hypothetical protein